MKIDLDTDLTPFNTFGIQATARYFSVIQTTADLVWLLSQETLANLPKFILGGGSNILLTQNYDGLVIKNNIKGIKTLSEDDEYVWIEVGAGENWHTLVMHCVQQGWSGIENLSLIPGTVGAAPIQNIGAYGVELSDVFCELQAFNLDQGITQTFTKEQCQFGYRDSVFKHIHKNKFVILSLTLRLNKKHQFNLQYGNIHETLQHRQVKEPSLKEVSDAVIHIRQSKLPDPTELGNAGSFFKNPIIPHTHYAELQKKFSQMPSFSSDIEDSVKVPAAWLIEQCGWKGKRIGDIGVYEKQALILVNFGAGRGCDIQALASQIQESVQNKFGILLTPEVNFI